MKNKTSRVVLSLLTIALLLSLISGATYALFTSTANVGATITSAKVEIEVEYKDMELYSLGLDMPGNTFANGGTASYDTANSVLTLENVTPGDKVVVHYSLINKSNVTIVYNVLCTADGKLAEVLETSVEGQTSYWTELAPSSQPVDVSVVVELPASVGNEYQEKAANVLVQFQALQGNAIDPSVTSASELQEKLNFASKSASEPTVLSLSNDIAPKSPIVVQEGTHVRLELNGNDIVADANYTLNSVTNLIKVSKGASLSIVDNSKKVRYGYWENDQYVISENEVAGADKLVGGIISLGNIFSTEATFPAAYKNQYTVNTVYVAGNLTLDGVTIAGSNVYEGNGTAIETGIWNDAELNKQITVTIRNSAICGNSSVGSAAIYSNGTLIIENSLISNNKSFNGGAIVGRGVNSKTYVTNSIVSKNVAAVGAVIQLRAGAYAEAYLSQFLNNAVVDMALPQGSKTAAGVLVDIMGNTPCIVIVQSCPISGNTINGVEIVDLEQELTKLISYYSNAIYTTVNGPKECVNHNILIQGQQLGGVLHQYYATVYPSGCH